MMRKLLILILLPTLIYSCSDSFEEVELTSTESSSIGSDDIAGSILSIFQADYDRGFTTGQSDGQVLIDDTFYEGNCLEGVLFQVENEDGLCYYTTPSQLNAMNQFIEDYNENLDALISSTSGATRAFHTGIKEGFNMKVCEFGYKYGYATFCAFVGGGPSGGPGGGPDGGGPDGGGPDGGGPDGGGPDDPDPVGGCGNQLICN